MKFWLGLHQPGWLRRAPIPAMVSFNQLAARRAPLEPAGDVFVDSGAYTRFSNGATGWDEPAAAFVARVRPVAALLGGRLCHLGPQDWLCGPPMLAATGLSVAEHQARTLDNYLELVAIAPDLPWVPMLQGWAPRDYARHADAYGRAGVTLDRCALVGVGSVAARQNTPDAHAVFAAVAATGLRNIHAMGVHSGLRRYGDLVASADSMAWSMEARNNAPMPGHTHRNCANCLDYALDWRARLLTSLGAAEAPLQLSMEDIRWAA